MQFSQIPLRMQKAWGADAAGAYIRTVPVPSQIGFTDGAASFTDGFVPDNFAPVSAGGVPPFGQDMNGALNAITAWLQWIQAGGLIGYDATFATAIGGYPFGSHLASNITAGVEWACISDNNLTNPDDPLTSVGWVRIGLQAGMPVPYLGTVTNASQFITANGTTVGSIASGAAQPADAYLFVFKAIWDQFSNTQCPIFDSGGSASTRGANAVADFIANKRLTTPNMKGLGVIGCDTMGGTASTFLAGVPVTTGNTTTPGSILGENVHTLITSETPVITPAGSITNGVISLTGGGFVPTNSGNAISNSSPGGAFGTAGGITQATSTFSGTPHGSGGSHNTVERNMAVYWGLKT